MASEVNTWAELAAVGVDVAQGSTQYWQTTGMGYSRLVSYAAYPLTLEGSPGTNVFEVHDVTHSVDASGNRVVYLQVTSKGTNPYGSYGLFMFFTDIVPT